MEEKESVCGQKMIAQRKNSNLISRISNVKVRMNSISLLNYNNIQPIFFSNISFAKLQGYHLFYSGARPIRGNGQNVRHVKDKKIQTEI